MSSKNFLPCLQKMLKHEGGFTANKKDPAHKEAGSSTNLGVTSKTWASYTGEKATQDVMKSLTPEIVAPLYKQEYWDRVKASNLPDGLDYCLFDFAVNAGVSRSAKLLQKLCKSKEDGIIGVNTLNAVAALDTQELIEKFTKERQTYYSKLKTFKTFGKGWTRRNEEVSRHALEMLL